MREIETDYLVIGAGASAMAFVDTLIAHSDAEVVLVDRRHRPGGHWLDAYPFVRLHSPSANYGVDSRVLGNDAVDTDGPNAGFYERATAPEVASYFNDVLERAFLPSGQVRFLSRHDYRGADADGHHAVSLLSGERVTIKPRRRFVDATYTESSIPSRHTPGFEVDDGVQLIAPNALVDLAGPATGYTVIGAGKTSMDTCVWLLDNGVAPDAIRWIKPRDGWMMNREYLQPLDLVGSYMTLQASWVRAAAEAQTGSQFAHLMEADGVFVRIDPSVDAEMFRGAILSTAELDALRQIENVVRLGRVRRIGTDVVTLDQGSVATRAGEIFIDCTAEGVRSTATRPVFEADRITLQYVTIGNVPHGAATIGAVEAKRDDDADKNRLCPPLSFTGRIADILQLAHTGMTGIMMRGMESDIAEWNEASRLNNARGAADHMDDPRVPAAMGVIGANIGPALANLEQIVNATAAAPA